VVIFKIVIIQPHHSYITIGDIKMLGTVLGFAASTSLGQGVVKKMIKDEIVKNYKEGMKDFEKLKKFLASDEQVSAQWSSIFEKIEIKTAEFLDYVTSDEQLSVFAKVAADKIPQFNGSVEKFKEFCSDSPAFQNMKDFSAQLLSPKIFQGVMSVAEKSGHIEELSKKEQTELVKILKSTQTAENLRKIDLKEAVKKFESNAKAFCKELELDEDDTLALEVIFEEVKGDHFASVQKIKRELEAHLPTILEKLLEYVYTKCPDLAIDKTPSKAITHAKNAPKTGPKEAAPKKKPAPKKPVEEVELSDSDEPENKKPVKKKPAPKKRVVEMVELADSEEPKVQHTIKKKRGPGQG
jgi:hypothetical protein